MVFTFSHNSLLIAIYRVDHTKWCGSRWVSTACQLLKPTLAELQPIVCDLSLVVGGLGCRISNWSSVFLNLDCLAITPSSFMVFGLVVSLLLSHSITHFLLVWASFKNEDHCFKKVTTFLSECKYSLSLFLSNRHC